MSVSNSSDRNHSAASENGSAVILTGAASTEIAPAVADRGSRTRLAPSSVHAPNEAVPPTSLAARLWRQKWLMLTIFVVIAGATIPLVWMLLTPKYTAKAVIEVSPVRERIVFRTDENGSVPLYENFVNSQVGIIRSPTVLQRVLDRAEVRQTHWYQHELGPTWTGPRSPIERLLDALTVAPRHNTEFIDVSFECEQAAEAKLVADTVVQEYKKYKDETAHEAETRTIETLASKRTSLQREIETLIQRKFDLSKQVGALDPDHLRSELSTQLSVLEQDEAKLLRERQMLEWKMGRLQPDPQDASATTQPSDVFAMARYDNDAEWRRLRAALDAANLRLDVAKQRYGKEHPRVQDTLTEVEHAKQRLAERQQELDQLSAAGLDGKSGAEAGLDEADRVKWLNDETGKRLSLLQEDLSKLRGKVASTGDTALELAQLEELIAQKRELYDAVRNRLQALEIEGKAPARIDIASLAIQPTRPASERRILLTIAALLAACGSAVGVGYLRASTDLTIHEAHDVVQSLHIPFLGQLPMVQADHAGVVDTDVRLSESVRMVRTALLERLGRYNRSAILVTSSLSENGKTSVAILLSKSLAQLGKKVLLVEADLRRPAMGSRLGLSADRGLAGVLMGEIEDHQAILRPSVLPFDVLLAGEPTPGFHADLLADGIFSTCLKRWKQKYDIVVLDGPPTLPVADGRILAAQVDGTIMVLRSSHCRSTDVTEAYAHLSASGGKLLGTVLIGGRGDRGYGYGYGYGYGSEYGSPDDNLVRKLEAKRS